ncbi:hypothetical protein [Sphingomonas glacialis]|uniref:hypothetical protein n=1 Tax=Sphingomonas glacialis TaxID=658225 RepID=UPI00112B4143|nr:hypothetical protein [Sphingomonas glacialis]
MKFLAVLLVFASPAIGAELSYPPKGSAQQRADFERGQANQAKFEQRLFTEAGFRPLADMLESKRIVRRALFEDPYMILPIPGVEAEHLSDGTVTIRVVGRAGESDPVNLPASAWEHLTSLEGNMLAPKPYVPWDPPKPDLPSLPPPPICHGWIVRFGTSEDAVQGSGSWAQCGGKDQPGTAFAVEMARLAVESHLGCKFDPTNPFWSFSSCFMPRPTSATN